MNLAVPRLALQKHRQQTGSQAEAMHGHRDGLARRVGRQQARAAELLLAQEQGADQAQQIDQQPPEVFEGLGDCVRPWLAEVLGEVEKLAGKLGADHEHKEQGHPSPRQVADLRG
jgi:hypothetical protein